jgi:hypothetical protein
MGKRKKMSKLNMTAGSVQTSEFSRLEADKNIGGCSAGFQILICPMETFQW